MSTVRIYKVAELLNTTSQEVIAILKRDHGIDVKSASGTIEEVVARQFVERQARERNLVLPPGARFTEGAQARGRRPAKSAEPAKPAAAPLPPPRLVKTVKPPVAEAPPAAEAEPVSGPVAEPAIPEHRPAAETSFGVPAAEPVPAEEEPAATAPAAAVPSATEESAFVEGVAAEPAEKAGKPAPGRIVPPTLRLRVEETPPEGTTRPMGTLPTARQAPAAKMPVRQVIPKPAAGPRPAAPAAARPAGPAPTAPRASIPAPRPPLGGPRPLPTPPVRPAGPSAPRPGMPAGPPRPVYGRPGGRPSGHRPQQRRGGHRPEARPSAAPVAPPPVTRSITLAEGMTVKDLADRLNVKAKDILRKLIERRMMLTINSTLDTETASMIAREFGADVQMRSFEQDLSEMESEAVTPEDMVSRGPVVTVMGHVDHGKTTLLDAIRETRVAEREAGGITQHIGAYQVEVNDRRVVFLDTPGHEAFTLMRARGARVTDVVVLVVAADDGVMPQTKEAIDHARAAGVPIVVAINKIDKPGANPERVKRELTELGLMPEEWGGQTVTVEVSAKKRQNLDALLEMILLVTDLSDLKAAPKRNASGAVLEAKLDRGRGPVATILVQDGTLHVGDTLIAGTVVGKVRALIDDRGRQVREAPPSTPVEVLGLGGLPQPGDTFQGLTDAAKARQIALFRQAQAKEKAMGLRGPRLTLQSLQQQIAEGSIKELPIIIKADVQGSAEVLADSLTKLSDDKVKIRIIHAGVGAISESDVLLASASNAIVIGFNVRPDRNAGDVAVREDVDVRLHSVIYNITDEIKKAMTGLLEPTLRETRLGTAEVRQVFKVPRAGTVAGCYVTDGRIARSGDAQARLLRDNVQVFEGRIASLRRFKDDVSEVKTGLECGISLERFNDIKPGDIIEAFVVERVAAAVS